MQFILFFLSSDYNSLTLQQRFFLYHMELFREKKFVQLVSFFFVFTWLLVDYIAEVFPPFQVPT